jgi:hypothetical protein
MENEGVHRAHSTPRFVHGSTYGEEAITARSPYVPLTTDSGRPGSATGLFRGGTVPPPGIPGREVRRRAEVLRRAEAEHIDQPLDAQRVGVTDETDRAFPPGDASSEPIVGFWDDLPEEIPALVTPEAPVPSGPPPDEARDPTSSEPLDVTIRDLELTAAERMEIFEYLRADDRVLDGMVETLRFEDRRQASRALTYVEADTGNAMAMRLLGIMVEAGLGVLLEEALDTLRSIGDSCEALDDANDPVDYDTQWDGGDADEGPWQPRRPR